MAAADLLRRDEAVVTVAGWHPDVHDRNVRLERIDHAEQGLGIPTAPGDLEAGVLEQPGEALAQQRLVVGDHDAHGISTRSWPSRRAAVPPTAPTRSRICCIALVIWLPASITRRRRPSSAAASTVTSLSVNRSDSTVAK